MSVILMSIKKKTSSSVTEWKRAYQAWRKVSRYVRENFEDVGHSFAKEALKVHYGQAEERNIRGVSTEQEEDMLEKEGVSFVKIPMLQEKDYPQAIKTLLTFQKRGGVDPKAGRPDPKGYHHPEIYYSLGNCYLLQENYKSAAMVFRKAVTRDKTHTYAWLNLAKTCYEMEQ